MVYTSYIANLKNLPEDATKIVIMRYIPESYTRIIRSDSHILYLPELSPSGSLFHSYKEGKITWKDFEEEFRSWLESVAFTRNLLNSLAKSGYTQDIFLLCCEKDPSKCHRSIVAKMIEERGGECSEYLSTDYQHKNDGISNIEE